SCRRVDCWSAFRFRRTALRSFRRFITSSSTSVITWVRLCSSTKCERVRIRVSIVSLRRVDASSGPLVIFFGEIYIGVERVRRREYKSELLPRQLEKKVARCQGTRSPALIPALVWL